MKMKRGDEQDDMFQSKRPKLDEGSGRPCYTEDSARMVSEWDDDELDCALDEVCVIAELSQRPSTSKAPQTGPASERDMADDNRRLLEKLRTKDGEVAILRSQLQQQVALKNSEANNHRRVVDEMEKKYKVNYMNVSKQVEKLQGELEFKDLEVKGLKEKCKQLEIKCPSTNFPQPSNLFSLSQAVNSKLRPKEMAEKQGRDLEHVPRQDLKLEAIHEGDRLAQMLPPSYFSRFEEPSVMSMYPTTSFQRNEFDRAKDSKYKWIGMPKSQSYLQEALPCIMKLMKSETFLPSDLDLLLKSAWKILENVEEMLKFVVEFPRNPKNDSNIMENECPGEIWSLGRLRDIPAGGVKEKGIEARVIMGVLSAVCRAGPASVPTLGSNEFLSVVWHVVAYIVKCRRPYDYAGFFVATCYYLQAILSNSGTGELMEETLDNIKQIIRQIILSRSKLDVLTEVMRIFASAVHHSTFLQYMCERSATSDCAMHIDARFQQALFFTHSVCPIKLLLIQVKTASFLCKSKEHYLEMLKVYTSWLRALVNTSRKPATWLFDDGDNCCDLLEGFTYLLYLCTSHIRQDEDYRKAFEAGIIALRNVCKGTKKKFRLSTIKVLSSSLRASGLLDVVSPAARKHALFVINEIESSSKNTSQLVVNDANKTLSRPSVTTS